MNQELRSKNTSPRLARLGRERSQANYLGNLNGQAMIKDSVNCASGARGFVALMTAIVLSLILLVVTVSLNQSGFLTRTIMSDSEFKEQSAGLAEACADYAILRLVNNPGYDGNEKIYYGTDGCMVRTIDPATDPITIETTASTTGATTNLIIEVDNSSLVVESWNEVASFGP